MDITQQFEATGAALTTTNALHHALILAEHDGLSGAMPLWTILDSAPEGRGMDWYPKLEYGK
jgi:hypothetical protein